MLRIIICGSRSFTNYSLFEKHCIDTISKIQYDTETPTWELEIISGGARGSDSMAMEFALLHKIPRENRKEFLANWNDLEEQPAYYKQKPDGEGMYNVLAGHNRNTRMVEYVRQNGGGYVIAFLKKGSSSKGTKDTIKKAKIAELEVIEIHV